MSNVMTMEALRAMFAKIPDFGKSVKSGKFASGGVVSSAGMKAGEFPAILSPGRSIPADWSDLALGREISAKIADPLPAAERARLIEQARRGDTRIRGLEMTGFWTDEAGVFDKPHKSKTPQEVRDEIMQAMTTVAAPKSVPKTSDHSDALWAEIQRLKVENGNLKHKNRVLEDKVKSLTGKNSILEDKVTSLIQQIKTFYLRESIF